MNLQLQILSFIAVCIFLATRTRGDHLLQGNVEFHGEFESGEGNIPYTCVANLRQTVVCWEDLQAEGLRISSCTNEAMQVKGNIDIEDFKKGVVLSIRREDYLTAGCPNPPITRPNTDPEHQPIIFRRIRASFFHGQTVDIKTTFLDAAKVIRKIRVDFVPPIAATGRQSTTNQSVSAATRIEEQTELSKSTRTSRLRFVDVSNSGNFKLDRTTSLAWNYRIKSGLCSFEFVFFKLLFRWEVGLDADAGFTLNAAVSRSISRRGTILKQGIPGAFLGANIRFLGRIGIGFSVVLGYESQLNFGMSARYSASARYQARQKVTMGLTFLGSETTQRSGNGISHDLALRESLSVRARASGFIGIRPGLSASIELARFGGGGAEIGATVGVEGSVQMSTIPHDRFNGPSIGVCDSCHHVRGTLGLVGRKAGIRLFVGKRSKEFVIADRLFEVSKTACLFRSNCFFEPPGRTGCSNRICPASCFRP